MVCADEELRAGLFHCCYYLADTLIHSFNRLDSCRDHTGMAYHIRICKVCDDYIVFSGSNCGRYFIANLINAHFRLQVIGRYLRRFYKNTVFTLVRSLYTAVEEEGNMCVFLRLSDSCLCHVMRCQILSECVGQRNLFKCNALVRDRHIILCEAYVYDISACAAVKAVKLITAEGTGDLSCTVRTEVEEDDRIAVLNGCNRLSVFHYYSRNYKLICYFFRIGLCNCFYTGSCLITLTVCNGTVSLLNTIPAVVAVHCVVTSHHRCDLTNTDLLHFIGKLLYIIFS